MRTRVNKNESTVEHLSWDRITPSPLHLGDVYNSVVSYDIMQDVVTPNFRRRIAAGEIINNPANRVIYTESKGGGVFLAADATTLSQSSGDGSVTEWRNSGATSIVPPWNSIIDVTRGDGASAKLDAISRIDKTPYAMGEDLAEIAGFLKGILSPLEICSDLSNAFLKQRRRGKSVSDAWLGVRYGFLPAIQSIITAHDAWSINRATKKPVRRTSRGHENVTRDNSETHDMIAGGGYGHACYHTFSWHEHMTAGILYEVTNPIQTFPDFVGLRFKDVPSTVWAVMPYTWVTDRFFNIGGAITGLANLADPTIRILTGWFKRTIDSTETYRAFAAYAPPGVSHQCLGDTVTGHSNIWERVPWMPSIGDVVPKPKLDTDILHAADLCALILQRLTY